MNRLSRLRDSEGVRVIMGAVNPNIRDSGEKLRSSLSRADIRDLRNGRVDDLHGAGPVA